MLNEAQEGQKVKARIDDSRHIEFESVEDFLCLRHNWGILWHLPEPIARR